MTGLADVAAALSAAGAALDRAHDAAARWSDEVRQTAERRLEVGGDDTAAVLTDAAYGRALDVLDAIEVASRRGILSRISYPRCLSAMRRDAHAASL